MPWHPLFGVEPTPAGLEPAVLTVILRGMAPDNGIKPLPKESESSVLSLYESGICVADRVFGKRQWLGIVDSNHYKQSQSLLNCLYSNPQYILRDYQILPIAHYNQTVSGFLWKKPINLTSSSREEQYNSSSLPFCSNRAPNATY